MILILADFRPSVSFHAVVVFSLNKDILFKSVLGHCAVSIQNLHNQGVTFQVLVTSHWSYLFCVVSLSSSKTCMHWLVFTKTCSKNVANKIFGSFFHYQNMFWSMCNN